MAGENVQYTREWKFRAWDPVSKKMLSPEDLEEPDTEEENPKTIYGQLINGKLDLRDLKSGAELLPMQSTNWFDREQYEVFEGDIVEIDGTYSQIIWDEMTAGYLLLDEDGMASPGGDYLGDVMKIVGNIFENGDADPEDRRRVLEYRAWDPASSKMYQPEDLKDPQEDFMNSIYGYLSFGALYIYDFINDPPMELIPMQFTGWIDRNGKKLFEGDVLSLGSDSVSKNDVRDESVVQIAWSDEIGQFIFETTDGTLLPGSITTAGQSVYRGNIYQNPELFPQR